MYITDKIIVLITVIEILAFISMPFIIGYKAFEYKSINLAIFFVLVLVIVSIFLFRFVRKIIG